MSPSDATPYDDASPHDASPHDASLYGVGSVPMWQWAVPGGVMTVVGGTFALLGASGVMNGAADGAPGRQAGLVLAGLVIGLFGVALLRGNLRSAQRFVAVAAMRPAHSVVMVGLGDGYEDALRALGIDPFTVPATRLVALTAAADDVGVELWSGVRPPSLLLTVPWSAVDGVEAGASHTAGAATAPSAVLRIGSEKLRLVPRRGITGNGWGTPAETLGLVDHLEMLRTEGWPDPDGDLGTGTRPLVDDLTEDAFEEMWEDTDESDHDPGEPLRDVPVPPAEARSDEEPAPTADGSTPESIEERIRRLSSPPPDATD